MHSEEQAEFEALIKDEMPELGAMWFKFYSRESDDMADAGGFVAHFVMSDSLVEDGTDTDMGYADLKQLGRVVRDHYDLGGCGHAHDCCGCVFLQSVNVVERYSSVYVEVNFGRNY